MNETDVVDVVTRSMSRHIEEVAVIWRGSMALATLAGLTSELSFDISMSNIHEALIDHFNAFRKHPLAQQQILWLLAAFATWPRSYRVMHKSRKVLDFLKHLVKEAEEKDKQEIMIMMEGTANAADVSCHITLPSSFMLLIYCCS
jgi:hypothetical protein